LVGGGNRLLLPFDNETSQPSSTISGTEPLLNAITGVPQTIASINTKPKGSGQAIGASSAMAPLR